MVREQVSIVIERPVEEVFDYAVDIERLPEWNGPLQDARVTSAGPVGQGTTYEVDVSMLLGMKQTVEARLSTFERPSVACFETTSGLSYQSCRRFEAVDGATKVSETLEADPGPIAGLVVTPMIRSFARTQQENLRLLKTILEDDARA